MTSARIERYRGPVGVASIGLLLIAWQLVSTFSFAGRLTGSPSSIALAVPATLRDGLVKESAYSLQALAIGLALAIVFGVALGLLLGRLRWLLHLLDPMLMALYVTPNVALLPLIVIWMGVGNRSTTVVVLLSAIFPILINTVAGMRQLDPIWGQAVRAFGGSSLTAFRLVAVPGALPEIMLGIQLGVGRGLIGVIVAEMYASSQGIGFLLDSYSRAYRISELFVVVIAIGVFGFALVQCIRLLEERVSRWRK